MADRPEAVAHDPHAKREAITGADTGPEQPYPIYLQGSVQKGFGRGSKELGCPTANLPDDAIVQVAELQTGVHYGWAQVTLSGSETSSLRSETVLPMVMSVGWNPFYKNQKRTAEVHILHDFERDFYGSHLKVIVLAFIRPEYDYAGLEALIKDINTDKQVTLASLDRPAYQAYRHDHFFDLELSARSHKQAYRWYHRVGLNFFSGPTAKNNTSVSCGSRAAVRQAPDLAIIAAWAHQGRLCGILRRVSESSGPSKGGFSRRPRENYRAPQSYTSPFRRVESGANVCFAARAHNKSAYREVQVGARPVRSSSTQTIGRLRAYDLDSSLHLLDSPHTSTRHHYHFQIMFKATFFGLAALALAGSALASASPVAGKHSSEDTLASLLNSLSVQSSLPLRNLPVSKSVPVTTITTTVVPTTTESLITQEVATVTPSAQPTHPMPMPNATSASVSHYAITAMPLSTTNVSSNRRTAPSTPASISKAVCRLARRTPLAHLLAHTLVITHRLFVSVQATATSARSAAHSQANAPRPLARSATWASRAHTLARPANAQQLARAASQPLTRTVCRTALEQRLTYFTSFLVSLAIEQRLENRYDLAPFLFTLHDERETPASHVHLLDDFAKGARGLFSSLCKGPVGRGCILFSFCLTYSLSLWYRVTAVFRILNGWRREPSVQFGIH
ncbi:hypothetical protein E5Q_04399 [Mixia osmundae IAM 14324]|uniref:Riboflavin kinase n=1 Tax=Mixia osmundae (strain CBS 9802 / IAM 14324 / JCM 22182 / KY 12970) TaxID=764103 RepID=G7E4G0_MIXOS|nr:hypothetical protein E5Q_04399 [Mixia osmundae IAM 14324]